MADHVGAISAHHQTRTARLRFTSEVPSWFGTTTASQPQFPPPGGRFARTRHTPTQRATARSGLVREPFHVPKVLGEVLLPTPRHSRFKRRRISLAGAPSLTDLIDTVDGAGYPLSTTRPNRWRDGRRGPNRDRAGKRSRRLHPRPDSAFCARRRGSASHRCSDSDPPASPSPSDAWRAERSRPSFCSGPPGIPAVITDTGARGCPRCSRTPRADSSMRIPGWATVVAALNPGVRRADRPDADGDE